jgi:hypothetical protein
MGLPVTVYRWDDAGAPQLVERRPSELITILKKCLVEGYGTKSPLGWTAPFEDVQNRKIVFRNSPTDGSGGVLRFADFNTDDRVGGTVIYTHGKIANSVDEVLPLHVYNSIFAQTVNNTQWVIIGTSRSFYLIVNNTSKPMASGTSGSGTWWFGDLDPSLPYDQSTMMAFYASTNNTGGTGWNLSLDYLSNGSGQVVLGDANNDIYSAEYQLYLPMDGAKLYSQTSASNSQGVPVTNLFLAPVLVKLKTLNSGTKDAFDTLIRFSESRPVIRGAIAGLYEFAQGGYSDQPWPQIHTQQGRSYWIIRQGHVGSCNVCIDLDTWYE